MSGSKILDGQRFDTRGLPEDYDPRRFYEYRYMLRSKEATGIEGLILKYMPFSVVRSLAFAIDPYSQFRHAPGRITPVNRKVIRSFTSNILQPRYSISSQTTTQRAERNWNDIPGNFGPPITTGSSTRSEGSYGNPQPLYRLRNDTTRRSRLIGSTQGEFELFKFNISAPANSSYNSYSYSEYWPTLPGQSFPDVWLDRVHRRAVVSPGASLSKSKIDAIMDSEFSYASELIDKHAVSMYGGLSPQFRNFSFFRELVELRDLPRSVLSMKDTVRDLTSVYKSFQSTAIRDKVFDLNSLARDIPKEYLGYHFGWKQIVRSINDLLAMPTKASKQISSLILRSGKASTYRSKRTIPFSSDSGHPSFDVLYVHPEENPYGSYNNRLERTSEIRMVINTTFDFPPINTVQFARRKFYDKLGLYPRPTDLYNLIPWTWLVDWFTGIGDYVNVIDEINRDRSLVNWGMITVRTKGSLTTRASSFLVDRVVTRVAPSPSITVDNRRNREYTARMDFDVHIRKDIGGLKGVRKLSDPDSLTPYQQSILGALLSERTRARR